MSPPVRIGVDLGGTKIEAVAIDSERRLLVRRRLATPREDYDETLRAIVRLVADVEREAGVREAPVGMGIPGTISPATGVVKNANSTWLNGRPLRLDVESRLGRPVPIENDANCFALSEARDGAGRGRHVVFGVILGTGCGGGLVVNGRPIVGLNAIAGEWGHNPLPSPRDEDEPAPECWCGRRGCIETYLSGPGLSRDHERACGDAVEAAEIFALAEAGDPRCLESVERYERRLSRSLATVVNLLDPDVIVLGGGVSKASRLYDRVPDLLATHVFSDRVDTPVLPPRHGDASGVRGAAWLTEAPEDPA